jgi:hypothetical protein
MTREKPILPVGHFSSPSSSTRLAAHFGQNMANTNRRARSMGNLDPKLPDTTVRYQKV